MERDRGGDQPIDVILPRESSKEFAQDYLRRILTVKLYESGDEVMKLPCRLRPVVLSADANNYSSVAIGAHCEKDGRGPNHYQTFYDVIITEFERVDTLRLDDASRARFQILINDRSKQLRSEGETDRAQRLASASLSLSNLSAVLRVGVETTYSFSHYGDTHCSRTIGIDANLVPITPNNDRDCLRPVQHGSEEWELDEALSAVTLNELYMVTDKLEQAGMLPAGEAGHIRKRYPLVLAGHKSI